MQPAYNLSVFFWQIAISAISNSILVLRDRKDGGAKKTLHIFFNSCPSPSRMLLFAVGELLEKGSLNAKGSSRCSSNFYANI